MKILNWLLKEKNRSRKARSANPRRRAFGLEFIEERVLMSVAPFISEVNPGGSGNGTYAADWFEITNPDTSSLDITGWKMDDNSNASASSVALRGVTSIPAGKSAVFFEGTATGTTDAAIIAAFSTAWFGSATPPAGFLIGAYGGSGVGLSTTTDAVNLFDAAGNRITGVSFGAATAATTFDNAAGLGSTTLPLPADSTLSVAGVNGAFVSTNGLETGSPGTIGVTTVDLSSYVRIGRFELPEPTRTTPPTNSLLAQEASAVTYDWNTNTLFVVGDGGTSIVQVSKTGQLIDSMTLAPGASPQGTDFYDPEGLAYVGNGKFVMSEERDRQAVLFTYVPGTTLTRSLTQTVKLGTFVDNIGIEGISYDPMSSGFIAVKETQPEGIFQTGIDFAAGTATNGSPTTVNSINLFDPALANLLDFADVYALSNVTAPGGANSSHLLVLSQESGKIVNIDRLGNVYSSLTIVSDPGNPLSVANQQHEGLAMDGSGFLYVVSENGGGDINHPQLWVYAPSLVPNQAPTAIALNNTVNAIAENTSTAAPIRVADIAITDDGLGTNNLSLSGPDASFFEIAGNALFIKAGTVLDFETKTSYSVTVSVDDTTVGGSPDATAPFTLAVTDVVNETPTLATLIISEVSPWSSGNAPYAADWFEVTNTGSSDVNITGWKMDDNSNLFANAVTLRGVTIIPAGKSAVFFEGDASGVTDAAISAGFSTAWFGTASLPTGFLIGSYGGSGVGLSTSGDAVNLFDAAGNRMAGVTFGASTTGATFDNSGGLATVTALSALGIHGAFLASDGIETGSPGTIAANVTISEVTPWSSGNSPYTADWFEVTNTGNLPVNISGWMMDDNSNLFGSSVALRGLTAIAAGKSAVFIEGAADGSTDASIIAAFSAAWFGSSTLPAGFLMGTYGGGGVGLSTGGDAVNLFDSAGNRTTGVSFGASTTGFTFNNKAGLGSTVLPLPVISTLSVFGVNGAFLAFDGIETGSPGTVVDNTAPTAVADGVTTAEDTAVTFNVLTNDSDPNGDTLKITSSTSTANGTLVSNGNGSFTYTPVPNFNGSDSFSYSISDGKGGTASATVSIAVNAVNDAPVAANEGYTTNEDVALNIAAAGVLANDSDVEGSPLTAILVSGVAHGTLTLNADGSFSYVPAANFSGTDSFTYHANDGTADSNLATVTITVNAVNDAPVANNDAYMTKKETALKVSAPGVLANDTDVEGSTLTLSLVSGVSHGKLTLNPDGSFTYKPREDFKGTDSFTYVVSDGSSISNVATVTITVAAVHSGHDDDHHGEHDSHHGECESRGDDRGDHSPARKGNEPKQGNDKR